jgi:hypothetical protein
LEVSGQLHAPAALLPGKSPRYPFYRRLGGPQSRSGRYGEVKIFYPIGTRTLILKGDVNLRKGETMLLPYRLGINASHIRSCFTQITPWF